MRKITTLLAFLLTLCVAGGCAHRSSTTKAPKPENADSAEKSAPKRPYKKVEQMTIDEAREAAAYFKEAENDQKRAIALERVILLTGDPNELNTLMHELAQLHEKMENYEEAGTIYEQYTKLFPGNQDVNYMTYKMLDILSKQIHDVLHDQSKIKQLAEQADAFLARFGQQDKHAKWVATLRTYGYQLLTRGEITRAQFYLDRYTYTEKPSALNAAGKRLEEAERVIVNLDLDEKKSKIVEETMDTIRAEDFEKLPDTEKTARVKKAITVMLPLTGEESPEASTTTSFFKRLF